MKLSYVEGMFGPPLEMFHCGGTAVTYDVTGHDEYLVGGLNSLVISRDDEDGVVSGLRRLAADRDLLGSLRQGARHTAEAWPDWDASGESFASALRALPVSPSQRVLQARIQHLFDGYVMADQYRLRIQHFSRPLWQRVASRLRKFVKS